MRYALFFAPPATSPLWHQGSRWLGRDASTGDALAQPSFRDIDTEIIVELTREPSRYGFHATLVAPFRLKDGLDEPALIKAVEDFSERQRPLVIPSLAVAKLDHFFCLQPKYYSAPLQALAALCTRAFDRFRAPLNPSELARRKAAPLNGQEKKNLDLWGYPYVFEQFRFHFTLTACMAEGKCKDRVHVALQDTFEPHLNDSLFIDALCLFVEPAPGQPLRCVHRFPFSTDTLDFEEPVSHDQQPLPENFYPGYQCHSA